MSIKFEITKQNNIHFGIAAAAAALAGYFTSASWWVILLFAAAYFGLVNVKQASGEAVVALGCDTACHRSDTICFFGAVCAADG